MTKSRRDERFALVWFNGLRTAEEQKGFTKHLLDNSRLPCLRQIKKIAKLRFEELDAKTRTTNHYDNPNWGYLAAHNNGRREELQFIIDLLSFVEDKKHDS